ncbi:hypothetical protein Ancab_020774 [Ancistrocladus abbreviatus]
MKFVFLSPVSSTLLPLTNLSLSNLSLSVSLFLSQIPEIPVAATPSGDQNSLFYFPLYGKWNQRVQMFVRLC